MKIEIVGRGPITPAQLDEILFGTSTINRKSPLEEAMDKLINEVKRDDEKKYKAPICFNIQAIFANHKKNAFTVVWGDGSHTIVHLQPGDVWDNEKALAMCFVKHLMGDKGSFNDIFTEEMPAKIKHIGKVEPVEEPKKESAEPSLAESLSKMSKAANASLTTTIGLSKEAQNFLNALERTEVKRYDLFLIDPCGDKTEIYHQGTDEEIHKAMRAYRMKHYPILEANRTPYRVWMIKDNLMVDFGAGSYFMVPGMNHDIFVKGK
jgi:hypothetical protein